MHVVSGRSARFGQAGAAPNWVESCGAPLRARWAAGRGSRDPPV